MKYGWAKASGGRAALGLLLLAATGACVPILTDDPTGEVLGSSPNGTTTTAESSGENNNDFTSAQAIVVPTTGDAQITGRVTSTTDVDLFDLGPASVGDFVTAEVEGDGVLDPVAALFDADGNLLFINDDRNFFAGVRSSLLELTVAANTTTLFLAIASSPDAPSAGDYTGRVSISRGLAAPSPVAQAVVLDFDGASSISIGGRPAITIPAFDAALIDPTYQGQTDAMVVAIQARVNQDFGGLNVILRTSAQGAGDPATESIVYFGTFSPTLLGLADNVDPYNSDTGQQAIIYTDTFNLFMPLQPTVDEMAQALANVASHEIGHLLGLNHTADAQAIMDITATASQLLANQRFQRSPLVPEIFPIGSQDGLALLIAAVGETSAGAVASLQTKPAATAGAPLPLPGEFSMPKSVFATCGCQRCQAREIKRALYIR